MIRMYKGRSSIVKTPTSGEKGSIHILTTGYVYLATEYHWDKESRQPREKRYSIGKIVDGDRTHMYPNATYETFFGPIDSEAQQWKEHFSSEARKTAGKMDSRISFGPYAAIDAVGEASGCFRALRRVFPDKHDKIEALAMHSIVARNATAQLFPGWCFDHYCGMGRVTSDSEISALYARIGEDEGIRKVFFRLFREEIERRFPASNGRVVAFDSTNQNTSSQNQPMARRGKAKRDMGLPIIHTAMFVDEDTGIPLWYEHYDGSVLDKTQTPFSLKRIVDLGYRKLFAMFDRGYYCKEVIQAIRNLEGIEYGVLCPENVAWVDTIISEHWNDIKDRQACYDPAEKVYGKRYATELYGMPCHAYLFYDAARAQQERESIHEAIAYFWKEAGKRKRYSAKMEETYAARGILVVKTPRNPETGKDYILLEDTEHIQDLLDHAGYFVMVSDTEMTIPTAIRRIRRRDTVETVFESMKRHFGMAVTYTHGGATYEGKMFMAYIAAVLFAVLGCKLRKILDAKTSETLSTIMAELNKYKIELQSDGTWTPVYAMSKKQKEIFAALGLSEQDVVNRVSRLNLLV